MLGCDITEPRLRCVLPFKAVPAQMALLRKTTSKQLRQWGTPDVVEDAELLVTELASNVVKHVGEGEPATLILEWNEGRLRLEVHDTSPVSPSMNEADWDHECGRGLHLIAFVATDWGTRIRQSASPFGARSRQPQTASTVRRCGPAGRRFFGSVATARATRERP